MAPEKAAMEGSFYEEAIRISKALQRVQSAVQDIAESTESSLLENIRQELGYEQPEAVDTSDLIDTRITETTLVLTPRALEIVLPISSRSAETTRNSRLATVRILTGEDDRVVVVAGPCSLHDPKAALEYAQWVLSMREKYGENLEIIMRAYMEKPRTELGWKGLIIDPHLDDSCDINLGVVAARMLACGITNKGVPIGMERLNANTPQYFNGLVTYDTIGARNTTDQKSREYGSGTSSPVGFKNTPEGSIQAAAEAVNAARAPHTFLGTHIGGIAMQVHTTGNEHAHIILRGDSSGPNYSPKHITEAKAILRSKGLPEKLGIDLSHANSRKDPHRQIEGAREVARQIALGEAALCLVMIESNLVAGRQDHVSKLGRGEALTYGQSITDGCAGLDETEEILEILSQAVVSRRGLRDAA